MVCHEVRGHGAANVYFRTHRSEIEFAATECIELSGNVVPGKEHGRSRCLFDHHEFELSDWRMAKNDVNLISATQEIATVAERPDWDRFRVWSTSFSRGGCHGRASSAKGLCRGVTMDRFTFAGRRFRCPSDNVHRRSQKCSGNRYALGRSDLADTRAGERRRR